MPKPEKGFKEIDARIGVACMFTALICLLLNKMLPGSDNYLNVCVMTIASAFIVEMNAKSTWQSGISRCIVIGIGVVFGLVAVFLDNLFKNNDIIACLLLGVFTVLMLIVEKMTGKMYVQCKLGAVSLILTVFTFRGPFYAGIGKTCYLYGVMFFVSTVAAALITFAVMYIWDAAAKAVRKK